MHESQPNPLNPNYLVQKIALSPAYAEGQNAARSVEENDHARRSIAIRLAATALSHEGGTNRLSLEGHAMNVTSRLTTFLDTQLKLDENRQNHGDRQEKLHLLTEASEFNHAIKEMIDTNPSLKYLEVLNFLNQMNLRINGNDGAQKFDIEMKRILSGMRHEIAVEQMLWMMDGVEYKDATVEQDMKGADMLVSINGSQLTPIDIKSTEMLANSKKAYAEAHGKNPDLIVWSHVTTQDFRGGFRIDNTTAHEVAPILYDDLLQAVTSYNRKAA